MRFQIARRIKKRRHGSRAKRRAGKTQKCILSRRAARSAPRMASPCAVYLALAPLALRLPLDGDMQTLRGIAVFFFFFFFFSFSAAA